MSRQERAAFPHCDSKVLHEPGVCVYCDKYPDWQELRKMWGIAFTGGSSSETYFDHAKGEYVQRPLIPCPSEQQRPLEIINKWHGNVPVSKS